MEFHISRDLRAKLDVGDLLFGFNGNVVFANVAASRKLVQRWNAARGEQENATAPINAGALFALGLIDELNHAMVARYREDVDPAVLREMVKWFTGHADPAEVEKLLLAFTENFPNVAIYNGKLTAAEWLAASTEGMPNREAALEELLLLWIANRNPAFAPFRELFDDAGLKRETVYSKLTAALPDYFATRPEIAPEVGSLLDALLAPILASPDSLTGQLEFIREKWTPYLGEELRRVLLAIDVVREEDIAIWMRFHPPSPDSFRHGAMGYEAQGFVGDEYVGFEGDFITGPDGVRRRRYAEDYQAPLVEYENFSADQAWMPTVVLMAKSTYVWLEQLSKKYLRHIHRLDQIPDEELRLLSARGVTGLWLIGLWERSSASRTIKRLRGHADAVASAYSLKEYKIAEDLGGNAAYETLRDRAAAAGIRLASDMVPNHMGIDSDWVIEHPDWFLSRPESPFPAYSFEGPDLSVDSRVEIKIEDHYYDQTDAAVVFRLRHHADGQTRFMYHGNDGTTFAWNDTAQLDYSKQYVREHVIQTILQVARLFPIIRFDAAMVLAKRHVQRLWFPLPGAGGSIPSRAEDAMSDEQFEQLMPHEFWREVVDRVAVEVPGTLLLAEAFWLLEGYFVRTLGMHRVYNSAFMNMLRDEENSKYRSYLKKTIEFDPDILKRYVNFMSNPDERTAIDQFGSGDKYFGTCTLLATLPGLPMLGHGQIEGYTERYGMEFKQAKQDERPNEDLVARHQREIAPLLKSRHLFAESTNFLLYDFWTGPDAVNENVFAYSNRFENRRALILYNNAYESTSGTIHISVASMDKGSGSMRQTSLSDGLALSDESAFVAYRDMDRKLEYLRSVRDIRNSGLSLSLGGYQKAVLLDWRVLQPTTAYPWDQLCWALNGAGVHSLDEAVTKLRMRPLTEAMRGAISLANVEAFATVASDLRDGLGSIPAEAEAASVVPDMPVSQEPLAKQPAASAPTLDTPAEVKSEPAATDPQTTPEPLDPRLAPFVDETVRVLDALIQASQNSTAMLPEVPSAAVCRTRCAAIARAVLKAASWPSTSPGGIEVDGFPLFRDGSTLSAAATWGPVLAGILAGSIGGPAEAVELFDTLPMRPVLAEVFSFLGLEGEDSWRAAARVRVMLLAARAPSPEIIETAGFWADPDVRWLAGAHDAFGATYVNKEQMREVLDWFEVGSILYVSFNADFAHLMKYITDTTSAFASAAEASGYNVGPLLASKARIDNQQPRSPDVAGLPIEGDVEALPHRAG